MMIIVVAFLLTQCVVESLDSDAPRFFTNGHGGYQFFHANEDQLELGNHRRMDSEASFSENVEYVVSKPDETTSQRLATKKKKAVSEEVRISDSGENRILKDTGRYRFTTPSALQRQRVTRKRIVVRKFQPPAKAAEKNKKREISPASAGNRLTRAKTPSKFASRYHKPPAPHSVDGRTKKTPSAKNRSALFARQPNDTFLQLHMRKLNATTTTTARSTTTPSALQKGMIEKRHLANVRFFNRRRMAH